MKILRYIKNILIIVCLCFSILTYVSKCNAYNIDDIYEYAKQLNSQGIMTFTTGKIINNYWQLKNIEVLKNSKSILVQEGGSTTNILYFNETYKISFRSDGGSLYGLPQTYMVTIDDSGNTVRQPSNKVAYTQSPQKTFGLLDLSLNTQDEIDHFPWSNWYLNNRYDEPVKFTFTPYNDGTINVFYNGSSDSFLRFNLSRSVNQWALGKLDGLSADGKIDLKLNRFMNGEFTTSVGSAQWYSGQKTSFGGLSIADDGVVYIKNDSIYYNQGYNLIFDVDGENVDNYLFYFVPYAYSSSSGDLLSPDIDTNSDLEILQNLQDLVNIQNIGAIYDNSFASGEIYNTLGYSDYDNIYSEYLKSCFQSLNDTFSLSGDVSVDVSFLGKNLTLRSSNFVVPDGPIKFFCSSFLVFGTIFYFYKQFSHFYHKLQEGDFEAASETFAVDDESLLM